MYRYGGDYSGGFRRGWTGSGNYDWQYGGGARDFRSRDLGSRNLGGRYFGGGAYGGGMEGMRGNRFGYDRDLSRRVYRPSDWNDERDWGDRLREGWNDLRRGMRRTFGGGYDRDYGPRERSGYGYRGGYRRGYDRGWF